MTERPLLDGALLGCLVTVRVRVRVEVRVEVRVGLGLRFGFGLELGLPGTCRAPTGSWAGCPRS